MVCPEDDGHILIIRDESNLTIEFLQSKTYTIGRGESCDFHLRKKGISRCHATIFHRDEGFWIIDGDLRGNSSTNGLLINSERKELHRINHGDLITLANDIHCLFLDKDELSEGEANVSTLTSVLKLIPKGKRSQNIEVLETFRKNAESASKVIQYRDDLTNLLDRKSFISKLEKLMFLKDKTETLNQFAVLFIDLDGFKLVNDSLGHAAGDQLLIILAQRMSGCLRNQDIVARFGGDEFVVLVNNIKHMQEPVHIANRLLDSIREPVSIQGQEIFPSASIGIASSEVSRDDPNSIISDADTAMYQAKTQGKNRIESFDTSMREQAIQRLQLGAELRRAIDNQEFCLLYQPIISIAEKRLVGFEALIRWQHPDKGLISPQGFIDYLDGKELMYQVGQWVIEESCRQLSRWNAIAPDAQNLSVSINLSAKQLLVKNLISKVSDWIGVYGVDYHNLVFEVTESMIMQDDQYSMSIIQVLRQRGIKIYIDDFGTGYSSLSYLHQFPVDGLKIDKSFITEIDNQSEDSLGFSITRSIIVLAHNLGVKVVAEGVENVRHLKYLAASKCDFAQGYLFSKPLSSDAAYQLAKVGIDWIW